MIDCSGQYWHGDEADDINDYLKAYSGADEIDVKPVYCHLCGGFSFLHRIDSEEECIQVECSRCRKKKTILDCDKTWGFIKPRPIKCPECRGKKFNLRVGFVRRENGSVRWVYIGTRCVRCGLLGSPLDWKISYEPTDKMENNI